MKVKAAPVLIIDSKRSNQGKIMIKILFQSKITLLEKTDKLPQL
jgi:hypothetical protein